MPCDRKHLLQRLSVEEPEALEGGAWKEHLRHCAECHADYTGLAESLAIFRQLEAERIAQFTAVPCWEKMSRLLYHHTRRSRVFRALRPPMAAAVAALLLVGGLSSLLYWNGTEPLPGETAEVTQPATVPALPGTRDLGREEVQAVVDRLEQDRLRPGARPVGAPAQVLELRSGELPVVNLEVAPRFQSPAKPPRRLTPLLSLDIRGTENPHLLAPNAFPVTNSTFRVDYPVR